MHRVAVVFISGWDGCKAVRIDTTPRPEETYEDALKRVKQHFVPELSEQPSIISHGNGASWAIYFLTQPLEQVAFRESDWQHPTVAFADMSERTPHHVRSFMARSY